MCSYSPHIRRRHASAISHILSVSPRVLPRVLSGVLPRVLIWYNYPVWCLASFQRGVWREGLAYVW